jgi:7-carboxy-7-deazaguanine synthase
MTKEKEQKEQTDLIQIEDIFYSISGEGTSAGLPSIFIRTAGCNFSNHPCKYCDTHYALDVEDGKPWTITDILNNLTEYPCKRVIITGGEPLCQVYLKELITALQKAQYMIEIETNGSFNISEYKKQFKNILWSLDIKTPCSGNADYNILDNLKLLDKNDQVKFVVESWTDFRLALSILDNYKPICNVLFSPVYGKFDPLEIVELVKYHYPKGRLSIQLHKIIGVE